MREPFVSRIITGPVVFSFAVVDTGLVFTPARLIGGLGDGELRSAGDGDGSGGGVAVSSVNGCDGDGIATCATGCVGCT